MRDERVYRNRLLAYTGARAFGLAIMLLGIAIIVLSLLVGLVLGVFSLFGEQVGLFAGSIGGALFGMLTTSVMVAVMAAVHRQLSDAPAVSVGDTFD